MLSKDRNSIEEDELKTERRKGFLSVKVEGFRSTSDVCDMRPAFPCRVIIVTSPVGRGPVA
jgi:hypothetical protein